MEFLEIAKSRYSVRDYKSGKSLWSAFGNYRLLRTYESMDTPV